jgi:hypothetical protein
MKYAKGSGPVSATFAEGGDVISHVSRFAKGRSAPPAFRAEAKRDEDVWPQKSQFLSAPDVFRTGLERNDYEKKGKGGEHSKLEGDSKSEKPIKPRS